MQYFFFLFFLLLVVVQYVNAHGYVDGIAVDGTWYAGNVPNNYKGPSPIRLVNDIGPVKGSDNPDIVCGLSAQKAAMVVSANAGSVLSIQWVGGGGQAWPHEVGPLMTYMASCGNTPCDQFDPSGAQWFKIDQYGKKPDGNTWYQADIASNHDRYDVTLPQNLASGGYLVRHEIIALHLGGSLGGAEFYPMCVQIQVGGNGNGAPQSTVSLPGAYNDNDPGIYDPDIYNPGSNYTFPGGPISNLAASAQSMADGESTMPPFPSGTSVSNTPASPTQTQAQTQTQEPTGAPDSNGSGTGSCMLKTRSTTVNQRRHFKRFMKRIMPHASH
ncbi:glycosyl hydrolase family 61-domain-containing protein [Irpex rosettiformis]|uniref:Glycosyl hydrolase family 61-domain-containing protein n=1 Tax=Irpex rosettiformis TaxID=378272 RepID=A0ACB8U6F7_9APHY|nr:glycosyl hydrolase family 61-domain-containing protein [Irpex rosettiformis]